MPELPEVETIRQGLAKVIVGRKIVKFESRDAKVVRFDEKDIAGLYITNIERRAKILIFTLSNPKSDPPAGGRNPKQIPNHNVKNSKQNIEKYLLCHLKMTGQLIWEACPGETEFCLKKSRVAGGHPSPDWVAKLPNKHTRAIFSFDDKSVLFFNDVRRFGYLKLYNIKNVIPVKTGIQKATQANQLLDPGSQVTVRDDRLKKIIPELSKLGPEPFSSEFNIEYLIKRTERVPNRKVKQFIIDQEIISGVGNIYVDEALFYAGILPTRAVKDISKAEWKKIIKSIKKALELGLKYGGSSEDTYVDAFGNPGTMNDHTKVYRKKGQPCGKCGTKVERIVLGGRGTHFCPKCQK